MSTVEQLADPRVREHLARMASVADNTTSALVRLARKAWAQHRTDTAPADMLTSRLTPDGLDLAWMEAVDDSRPGSDLDTIVGQWAAALTATAERGIDSLNLPLSVRSELNRALLDLHNIPASRAPKAGVKTYEFLGEQLSLAQISRHPQCVVSYNTLRRRVEEAGQDVHTAATTPSRRGRPRGGSAS
ncbi:hypothetical protein ABZ883_36595 [Streptomyces sp. NPDC046977]|uniref:hypothetical protein n=1 Tax=Streptomyces sp. NPDC046977 TaxID=3154703 RepID=UPI0033F86D4C